ncbi:helix-turn-helix domain-containing protein [Streptomyces cynarae]|uniref:helix-turn-helix domain-containing protein n=1 Tax=Streptomyces cynarae TaxID=2981134 RepID=UPI00406BE617
MSGATRAEETEAFARLLRELKDRSGLSYGALAKRLHMSTSTLHRYCNGTAVPTEYAPVERLARVCRATPQELVELHRHWILADAARRRGADQAAAAGSAQGAGPDASADVPEPAEPGPAVTRGQGQDENGEPVVVDMPGTLAPARRLRRRGPVLIASAAVAAALGAVVLTVGPSFGSGGKNDTVEQQAGATPEATAGATGAGKPSAGPSASGKGSKASASASVSPSGSAGAGSGTSKGGGRQGANQPADGSTTDTAPITVGVRPYVYDSPCSQHFLVDSEPAQVGPPASEQDAQRWASAYGAVSSNEQRIALTVQGTGKETVVLEALHIRVLSKGAPLGWNEYAMGDGCGGGVETRSFDADLDSGSPTLTVKNGQRDFPYKVSESDPEVYYVTVHTKAHDVRWDLTLDWSSGSRHGTVQIDNAGTPFRTCAKVGGTAYDYPLGGSEWERNINTN